MIEEAQLEEVGSGLAPASPGWFVVNVGEAAWLRNDAFGGRCVFESNTRVLSERPGIEPQSFADTGFTLAVLEPGKPTGMYHAESSQEDFLVLAGECLLVVEEQERPLRAWDFVHCPSGTNHTFVGIGDEPCVIFMIGARREGRKVSLWSRNAKEWTASLPGLAEAVSRLPCRQVLLDGARALRVEEPERQCAQLAGVVLLRSVVRGAGVAGGVRTALGRHAGWNSRTVHAVTPPSFTTFTLSTPSRFNERRNACNA